MRGEKSRSMQMTARRKGSPPHARGKGFSSFRISSSEGITPACAGKRQRPAADGRCSRDHPRMRGEKATPSALMFWCRGSPPHARGKADLSTARFQDIGITPACAGKRRVGARAAHAVEDHPRMRGEKQIKTWVIFFKKGSPPHARGKAVCGRRCGHPRGITPACAGKSTVCFKRAQGCEDHPRMRGEKTNPAFVKSAYPGSPPHARGKVFKTGDRRRLKGITPACAGKRFWCRFLRIFLRDHPRMRGEKAGSLLPFLTLTGSPPHARGKD